MPESGSCIFTNADSYQASLKDILDLVVMRPAAFDARLTWVDLPNLRLLRAQEASPRVASVQLPPDLVFITFPTNRHSLLICDGAELQFGDIMFHSRGERFHQRTAAASRWGCVSLTPASLVAFSRTLTGQALAAPRIGQILCPPPADRFQFLRLHAQAGRIAETHLDHITHPQVARGLEQDLVWALARCLATGETRDDPTVRKRHASIMSQFEAVLTANPDRLLPISKICSLIGVSEEWLGSLCSQVLGMSPRRYQRLRRLKLVRGELLRADPAMLSVADLAQRYGFIDVHRFIADYRGVRRTAAVALRDPANRRIVKPFSVFAIVDGLSGAARSCPRGIDRQNRSTGWHRHQPCRRSICGRTPTR